MSTTEIIYQEISTVFAVDFQGKENFGENIRLNDCNYESCSYCGVN